MVNSYVVSLLLVSAVPRARRLEHLFVAAHDPAEAERLARAIVAGHPALGRFQVDLTATHELPLAASHALPPPSGWGLGHEPPQTTDVPKEA